MQNLNRKLLTAINKEEKYVFKGYETGAVDYLFKPIDTEVLKSKVNVFCELHRQRKMLEREVEARKQAEKTLAERAEELAHFNAKLEKYAYYDSLTGLANRKLFQDRLPQAIARADRASRFMALMFLDLDRFKYINDTLGHDAGDILLKSVGERLQGCLRKTDTIARLGGDEFTIISEELKNVEFATTIARKVHDAITPPFILVGHEVFVTTSIGITIYPRDGSDVETLMKNADTAMYRAKEKGRNNYQFYTSSMNAEMLERLTLENRLRCALEREEFQIYYQLQMDLHTRQVIGMEALLRWQPSDSSEFILPAEFIPIAEETGLIVPIGE